MPRPPLPLGTMGEIRCYPLSSGRVRAMAKYRDYDGVTRQVERTGKSETQARNRLREACRDRGRIDAVAEITPNTTVVALAQLWFSEIQIAVDTGEMAPGTGTAYRDRIKNQIEPALGALRLREVTVSRVDLFLKRVREKHGVWTARSTRTVLGSIFGLAARHDAMASNPVRDTARLPARKKQHQSLTLEQVWDLRAKLRADQKAVDWDVVDFVDMMMATGLRIGETAAVTWPAVNLEAGSVEVRGTVIRITGKGLLIKWKPKSESGWRVVQLPSWAVAMLKRRQAEQEGNPWLAVFTSPLGHLRDPSNTQSDLRDVFDRAGYPDVSSHTFRRTVATLMDEAGLSARAAADQLGHAKVSMTQDHYFGRRIARTGAADLLESVEPDDQVEDESDDHNGVG